ncbi:MAG: hypothetical protein HYY65_10735 [Candidatus Tectomicrobia bacterium]|uniref:Uncharacterized protein n=1 Tax=Tectimicrobiota bacterium TaxID=2528274 RepID=A0A932GRE9_UNCTE|nr:hypothetical protein [Candidatus Tectomicrobia bacterium]
MGVTFHLRKHQERKGSVLEIRGIVDGSSACEIVNFLTDLPAERFPVFLDFANTETIYQFGARVLEDRARSVARRKGRVLLTRLPVCPGWFGSDTYQDPVPL